MIKLGVKCKHCGADNGVTMYIGKECKRCGKDLGCAIIPERNPELKKGGENV